MKTFAFAIGVLVLASHASAQIDARHHAAPWFYNSYAEQLGVAHVPGGGASHDDLISVVRALPNGAVVIAGSTFGSLGETHAGSIGSSDIFVARFGPLGDLEWLSQIGAVTAPSIPALDGNPSGPGGDATKSESAYDIAVADDGSIFLTGSTYGSLGETNSAPGITSDIIVAKFSASGALQWLRQIGVETGSTIPAAPGATLHGLTGQNDFGASIVLHSSGGVTVGGTTSSSMSEDATNADFFLARFDGAGHLQWFRQMGAISSPAIGYYSSDSDTTARIATAPSGETILGGYQWYHAGPDLVSYPIVMRFDDAGTPLSFAQLNGGTVVDLAIDPASGRIAIGGTAFGPVETGGGQVAWAALFDPNLHLRWSVSLNSTATAHLGNFTFNAESAGGVAFDPAGDVILCGTTHGSFDEPGAGGDIFTMKIANTNGYVWWVSQLGRTTGQTCGFGTGGSDQTAGGHGVSVGPGGMIVVGGSTQGSFAEGNAGGYDALLLRLNPNGKFR